VAAGQPIFFPNPRKTSIQLLLEAQEHKKYAQTTPLDVGVSSLLIFFSSFQFYFFYGKSLLFFIHLSYRKSQVK
jgi:hypothetical protein